MTLLRSLWLAPVSAVFVVALSATAGGCSTDDGTTADAGAAADVTGNVTCKNDSRNEAYTANMEKVGASSLLKFTLVRAEPGPPLKGPDNKWVIRVTDMNGQPLAAPPDVTITGMMPDHAHGWSTRPAVTKNDDGTITFDRMNMFMPGIWEITFTATSGPMVDAAAYHFCVD